MTAMSMKEAVAHTGYSPYVIGLWIKSGLLNRSLVDGKYVYQQEDLDAALDEYDPRGDKCFIADYNHFRDFGFTNERVAERMGLDYRRFMGRVRSLGIYRGSRYERNAQDVLDRLIVSGERFSGEALPCVHDEALAQTLLTQAVAGNRISKVDVKKSKLSRSGFPVNVYEGVAA